MLDKLVFFSVGCLTVIAFLYLFKKIDECNNKIDTISILLIAINSLTSLLFNIVNLNIIKTIISTFLLYVLFYYNSKTKKDIILKTFFVWIFGIFLDFSIMLITSIFLKDIILKIGLLIYQGLLGILVFIVLLLFSKQNFIKIIYKKFKKMFSDLKYLKLIILLFMLSLIIASFISLKNLMQTEILIACYLFFAIIIVNIFLLLKINYNKKTYNKTISLLLNNNQFYNNILKEYRIFKHNINNQLTGIQCVANASANMLINNLLNDYNSNINIPKIGDISNEIVGFIYQKTFEYTNSNINLLIENNVNSKIFDYISPQIYNKMCSALGVIVDNALEGTSNNCIYVDIKEGKEFYSVKICNEFSNDIDIFKLGNILYSTKNRSSGFGIFSIFQRELINMKVDIVNNLFIVSLKINKDKVE